MQFKKQAYVVLAAVLATLCVGLCVRVEAKTVEAGDAITSWIASGQVQETGDGQLVFNGVIKGVMFVRNREGVVRGVIDAAKLNCPARIAIDKKKNDRQSVGICTITAHEGKDVAYAQWKCSGASEECKGEFTFTGGTGQFTGIAGTTPFISRIDIVLDETGQMSGYAYWPKMTYSLP